MKGSILVFGITMMMLAETAFTQGARNLPPRPTLTGPVADLVNQIINAINKQDKTFVEKLLAPNATWADEDGHIFPATFFTNKLMQGMPRKLTATNITGETWGDAAWADEDGHIFPATFFTNKLMQGMPRKLTATNIAGETWGDAAWAAFDYTLDETLRDGTPNQIKGTETLMFRKAGNDWQVVLVHAAIDAKAITPH